ncbi:cytochrome c [Gammaproteobacteria bacterium]|nr:cytochrome c [Gammaproteobacteria bacterium]
MRLPIPSLIFAAALCTSAYATDSMTIAESCTGCHGVPGLKNAYPAYTTPKIAGQSEQYIVASLKAYRSGERKHPTMNGQAATLTDQNINELATWFATWNAE